MKFDIRNVDDPDDPQVNTELQQQIKLAVQRPIRNASLYQNKSARALQKVIT